jgi:hypothetical protein
LSGSFQPLISRETEGSCRLAHAGKTSVMLKLNSIRASSQ